MPHCQTKLSDLLRSPRTAVVEHDRRFTTHKSRSIPHVTNDGFQGPTAIHEPTAVGTVLAKAVRPTTNLRFVN